jgi:uncharacterized OsmC-like protein
MTRTQHIASCMQQAIDYLSSHPGEASYTDTPATACWEGGLRFSAESPNGITVVTDMPEAVGGEGSAPSPGWVMRAALATCDATLVAMRAAQEGIELEALEVVVDSESDDRGLLGMSDEVPAGPKTARVRIRVKAPAVNEERLREIIDWADEHSPVGDAVRRAVPTSIELKTAG